MIEVMYSSKNVIHKTDISKKPSDTLAWINAFNLGNRDLDILSKKLGVSRYIIKHFLDNMEISRLEKYNAYDVIILKALVDKKTKTLGIVKSKDYVLTTCPENININLDKDSFSKDSDHLLKSILNQIIKNFSTRLDKLEESIDYLENITFDEKIDNDPKQIFHLKKELIYIKKALNANKETISEMKGFEDINLEFHQMIDIENTLSSRITSVMEIYMTFSSNKLNEIIKSFTVIASLLLIPTIISGIYGMNVILPLGDVEGSFFIILGIMLIFMALTALYFKFKKWI